MRQRKEFIGLKLPPEMIEKLKDIQELIFPGNTRKFSEVTQDMILLGIQQIDPEFSLPEKNTKRRK